MIEATDRTLTQTLLERPDGIAELFSSAANPSRVRMMALLTCGEQGLTDLMRAAGLSKNATVNHLTRLMAMGMISRVGRGRYALTSDGRGLILTGTRLYMDTYRRGELERERMRQLYIKGTEEGSNLNRKTVTKKATYQCCWISFDGAVAGALRALGLDCDLVDVAGRSGYAFLLNVPKGRMCPSAPTAFKDQVYQEFVRGVSELGIGTDYWAEDGGYMGGENSSPESLIRAKALFERVKGEIDLRDRPLVLWGLPIPEFGIVNGYEGDSYVSSTFRTIDRPEKEELVAALDLKAPSCFMMVTFQGRIVTEERWLERAVTMASGKVEVCDGYMAGPKAAQEWSNVLLKAGDDEYIGNSYSAVCYSEGRSNAGVFLKRMARGHNGRLSKELMDAAAAYARGAQVMEEYVQMFPFNFQGKLEETARERGSALLLELKDHEEDALVHMKEALIRWP